WCNAPTRVAFPPTGAPGVHTRALHDALPILRRSKGPKALETTNRCLSSRKAPEHSPQWACNGIIDLSTSPSSLTRTTDSMRESRSEEHTSALQSRFDLVCRLLLEKKQAPDS